MRATSYCPRWVARAGGTSPRTRAGRRRRRARRAGSALPRRRRHRHDQHGRREWSRCRTSGGRSSMPRRIWDAQGGQRRRPSIHRLNPHVAVKSPGTRLAARNALDLIRRYDLVADGSQLPRAISWRMPVLRAQAAGDGGARPLRPHAHHHSRPRAPSPWRAEPDLSISLSGAPAAQHRSRPAPRPETSARLPASWAR